MLGLLIEWGFAPLLLAFSNIFVPYQDAGLEMRGYETYFHGKRFNGWTYELHNHHQFYRLIPYREGLKQGKEIHWYPSGRRWVEREFDHGQAHGVWKSWFEDGRVQQISHHSHGAADGELWAWHANGIVARYSRFQKGQEIAQKSWTFDGKPYYNYVYQDGEKVGILGGDFCKRK